MSSPQSQAQPAQPDAAQISHLVSSIVLKARENNTLSSLTPRLVRSEVENKLGVPNGTLDATPYKALVKRTIHDAMKREQTSGASQGMDGKTKKTVSKRKVGESARSPASKSIKSKETITDSDSEGEPKSSALKRKVKPNAKANNGEEKLVRSNSKSKSTKANSKSSKSTLPPAQTVHSGSKHSPPPVPVAVNHSDAESSDTTPRVSSSSRRVADKKSDSELSSLVDEPPKKKARGKPKNSEAGKPRTTSKRPKQPSQTLSKDEDTIKRLKSLVVACGVRKQWARELAGLDTTNAQIAHIRKILNDLGMVGRMSMEQAREIRAQRELAQELGACSFGELTRERKVVEILGYLDDVQKFEKAIVSGKPFKTESPRRRVAKRDGDSAEDPNNDSDSGSESASEREPPKVNNARRSIMAFLQDQSSDDD